jgi:hypothetical protein
LGAFYVFDCDAGEIIKTHADIDAVARELGLLGPEETIAFE